MEEKLFQVTFLPWLGLEQAITIGPITFWPYKKHADSKIKDKNILEYLNNYFNSFINHDGTPVESITICTYNDDHFKVLSEQEVQDMRYALDALFFSYITGCVKRSVENNNKSVFVHPSLNAFQLSFQKFRPESNDINVSSGQVFSTGWKIGEVKFSKPWNVGGIYGDPDKDLITGFDKTFSKAFSVSDKERLKRSLEWFRMSMVEDISESSKIVMIMTGLETFLKIPQDVKEKKACFADYIESKIATSEFIKSKRVENSTEYERSLASWWAWDFYKLRNIIVHGDSVTKDRFVYVNWITQRIVAILVFGESIKRFFFKKKLIGEDVRSYAKTWLEFFKNQGSEKISLEELEEHGVQFYYRFDKIHEKLGWKPEKTKTDALHGC